MRGVTRAGVLGVALAAVAVPAAAEAAYPGANGRIFLESGGPGRELFSIQPDGEDRRSLGKGMEPAVSPDGREIAFVRGGDLFLASRTGSDEIAVTNTDAVERTPQFSPSGNKLVFATDRQDGEPGHVFTIGVDGGNRTRLTQSDQDDAQPSYSPSGNKIVFVRTIASTPQIFKMDADGSNRDQLTTGPQGYPSESPTWSPDGNRIAFSRNTTVGTSLFSIEPDGSNPIQLTFGTDTRDRDPSYSPSGQKIVYRGQLDDEEGKALYVIDALGSAPQQLTASRQSGVDSNPYWGPTP